MCQSKINSLWLVQCVIVDVISHPPHATGLTKTRTLFGAITMIGASVTWHNDIRSIWTLLGLRYDWIGANLLEFFLLLFVSICLFYIFLWSYPFCHSFFVQTICSFQLYDLCVWKFAVVAIHFSFLFEISKIVFSITNIIIVESTSRFARSQIANYIFSPFFFIALF